MECTVSWTGGTGARSGMGFLAETGSGHTLMMDGAPDAAKPENGGQNLAPRPMETLLAGTGGCTAYDVVLILKRGRHDVRGCSVKLTSERAEVRPQGVHRHPHAFHGDGQGHSAAAWNVPLP
jgi:putative redox protein